MLNTNHYMQTLYPIAYTRCWEILRDNLFKPLLCTCCASAMLIAPAYGHTLEMRTTPTQSHHTTHPKKMLAHGTHAMTENAYLNHRRGNIDKRLVNFVQRMISNLHYSSYKLGGTHFDMRRGVYIVDCSIYVDHILKEVYPHAYSKLVHWSKSKKPTTHHYYHFFNNLSIAPQRYWNPVKHVAQLQPGDILVFRKKKYAGTDRTGHIMIVMDKPVQRNNMFMLRIADSAPYRHSHDTRQRKNSGIGIGTMVVKVNPHTYQPAAYAWTVGSHWKQNVVFAMARPLPSHMVPAL